jgi:hypothetical protein
MKLQRHESASETDSLSVPRQPLTKPPKRPKSRGPSNQYKAWICKIVLDCDLFYDESTDRLLIEEKTNLLKEHLRTRLNHNQPRAVLACEVLVDSSAYSALLSTRPGLTRILSNFSVMVTICFNEGTAFSESLWAQCWASQSLESDTYKLVKILLFTGERKAGRDNQLPNKLAIFYVSSSPLVILD